MYLHGQITADETSRQPRPPPEPPVTPRTPRTARQTGLQSSLRVDKAPHPAGRSNAPRGDTVAAVPPHPAGRGDAPCGDAVAAAMSHPAGRGDAPRGDTVAAAVLHSAGRGSAPRGDAVTAAAPRGHTQKRSPPTAADEVTVGGVADHDGEQHTTSTASKRMRSTYLEVR